MIGPLFWAVYFISTPGLRIEPAGGGCSNWILAKHVRCYFSQAGHYEQIFCNIYRLVLEGFATLPHSDLVMTYYAAYARRYLYLTNKYNDCESTFKLPQGFPSKMIQLSRCVRLSPPVPTGTPYDLST
jgi:hypothetical protein